MGDITTDYMDNSPVTADQVRSWTRRDPVLAPVVQFLQQSWPSQVDSDLTPFFSEESRAVAIQGMCVVGGLG